MTEGQTEQTQPATTSALSPERAYLDSQLEAGERLLWAGKTNVKGRMRRMRGLVILSLFMIFFCSGAFLLMQPPSRAQLSLLALMLILSLNNPKRTESYPPEKIDFIRPDIKSGGRGDLYFTVLRGGRRRRMRYPHGFLDIAGVEDVTDLMLDTFPNVA